MYFVNEHNKAFSRGKAFATSKHFIVCLTGGQARIYDKNFNHLQTIKGLQYVYKCAISPNEDHLLLISIANHFYIVSLETFETTKHVIKGKYNDNLEGRGCWTLDGKGCLFCVTSKPSLKSALRIYPNIESGEFYELLCDKYWLTSVSAVQERNLYLITGYHHNSYTSYLIWYDGERFRECLIDTDDMISAAINAKYIAKTGWCVVRGTDGTIVCNSNGKMIESITLPAQPNIDFSFSNIFQNIDMPDNNLDAVTSLSEQFGFEKMQIPDIIMDVCYSQTSPHLYIGTLQDLLCVNTQTRTILASMSFPFGVKRIEELDNDSLLIETWDSVELIRIHNEK